MSNRIGKSGEKRCSGGGRFRGQSEALPTALLLRCAQLTRYNTLVKCASGRRFFARLAIEPFLTSLRERRYGRYAGANIEIS